MVTLKRIYKPLIVAGATFGATLATALLGPISAYVMWTAWAIPATTATVGTALTAYSCNKSRKESRQERSNILEKALDNNETFQINKRDFRKYFKKNIPVMEERNYTAQPNSNGEYELLYRERNGWKKEWKSLSNPVKLKDYFIPYTNTKKAKTKPGNNSNYIDDLLSQMPDLPSSQESDNSENNTENMSEYLDDRLEEITGKLEELKKNINNSRNFSFNKYNELTRAAELALKQENNSLDAEHVNNLIGLLESYNNYNPRCDYLTEQKKQALESKKNE